MKNFIKSLFEWHRKHVFTFELENYKDRPEGIVLEDAIAQDLLREFDVYIVHTDSRGEKTVFVVDTNNKAVTPNQILEVFDRHHIRGRLVSEEVTHEEENYS